MRKGGKNFCGIKQSAFKALDIFIDVTYSIPRWIITRQIIIDSQHAADEITSAIEYDAASNLH